MTSDYENAGNISFGALFLIYEEFFFYSHTPALKRENMTHRQTERERNKFFGGFTFSIKVRTHERIIEGKVHTYIPRT
jgi:hypothetical protein